MSKDIIRDTKTGKLFTIKNITFLGNKLWFHRVRIDGNGEIGVYQQIDGGDKSALHMVLNETFYESLDLTSIRFCDRYVKLIDIEKKLIGTMMKNWILRDIIRHIENKMNLLLSWETNKKFSVNANSKIREKLFSTKVRDLEKIISIDNYNIEKANDFFGALRLIETLRNQLCHGFDKPEFNNYGVSLLSGELKLGEEWFKPNKGYWIVTDPEINHTTEQGQYPLQQYDYANINSNYIDSVNDYPATSSSYRGQKLSIERVKKVNAPPETLLTTHTFDNVEIEKINYNISSIENYASMIDLYLFPIIAKGLQCNGLYNSCVWLDPINNKMFLCSRFHNNKITIYRDTLDNLINNFMKKIEISCR